MGKQASHQDRQPAARKAKNEALPAEFTELRQRSNQGDPKARAELKSWLDSHPDVWRQLGDLAHHAQMEFIRLVTKDDFLFGEAIKRRADEMRRELLGPFPTPLEIIAVERIVAAYMQVQYVEGQIALADAEIPKAKFWLQRQLQANRLLHAATKSLLLIRELLPPEAPPATLVANGNGRFVGGLNGCGSAPGQATAAALVNRIKGAAKNGRNQALATA